jgi:beta-mannosidase
MEIREARGNYLDPQAFRNDKPSKEATAPRAYDLPGDEYKPSMTSSSEHLKPGSTVLKDGWKMICSEKDPGVDAKGWKDIQMPSQWAVADPELFSYGGNVWYMKKFTVKPEDTAPGRHLELNFKGVDYKSEVYLNGKKLGAHEGYFNPFSFSLDGKVKAGEDNTLLVKVSAPKDSGAPIFKNQIKGIFGQHDCRPGGNWAPSTLGNSGGIWNDVILDSTGMETIKNQYVDTTLSGDHKKADLKFNYLLENHDDKPKTVTVRVKYAPSEVEDPEKFTVLTKTVELQPGANKVTVDGLEENPKLWWTHDHGEPNLYGMNTEILEGDSVSDSLKGHFGIRKVEYDKATGVLKLNDAPLYQRGTNYIATEWLSTYNEEKFERDLHLMKDANLNSVRVHAHALPQEFYDKADQEGVLVWADFPLIWATSPSLSFMAKARDQYKQFIDLYRNHPSIAVWSAHNESVPFNYLMDHLMDRDAAKLDPTRHHKAGSGFTEHYYPGWYDPPYGKEYTSVDKWKPRMASEYGAEAIPTSIKDSIPADKQWPIDQNEATWKFHDLQLPNNIKYIGHPRAFKDLDDYIDTSQKYQYDYNKYVTEYFRRIKFKPNTGIYQFMFKEAWPSATWGVMDYKAAPKMAYEALKNAMNPTLVSIEWKKTQFKPGDVVQAPLWVINDNYSEVKDSRLNWKVFRADDAEKKPLMSGEMQVQSKADSSDRVNCVEFKIPDGAKPGDRWILETSWDDANGAQLSKNAYMFGVEKPQVGEHRYQPVNPEYPSAQQ